MPSPTLVVPHLRGCAWFEQEPAAPLLAAGSGRDLEVGWGQADVAFVEPLARRRLSRLARAFCHGAQRLKAPAEARVVFASRHGEADRTLSILQELAGAGEVSPALFSMSVHNAVPGLWAILKGSQAPATALAAGAESFGWGLMEAVASLTLEPDRPVLLVYADDRLPEPWAAGVGQEGLHSVALLLGTATGPELRLQREPATGAEPDPGSQTLHFLRAWRGAETCWRGAVGHWSWQFA